MNPTVIQAIIALAEQAIPAIGANSKLIDTIIAALVAIVPYVVQEFKDLKPVVQNIIAALRSDPNATADQLATLSALDAQCDAEFEQEAAQVQDDPPTT